MGRNEQKTIQTWIESKALVVVGCFERGSGKTTAIIEKARHAEKALILCQNCATKKVIERHLNETNVDGEIKVNVYERGFRIALDKYDMVLVDEADYCFKKDLIFELEKAYKQGIQVAIIGTVRTLDCESKLEVMPYEGNFDANPRIIPVPKSNLLYLGLRCKEAELIISGKYYYEEGLDEDVLHDKEQQDFLDNMINSYLRYQQPYYVPNTSTGNSENVYTWTTTSRTTDINSSWTTTVPTLTTMDRMRLQDPVEGEA